MLYDATSDFIRWLISYKIGWTGSAWTGIRRFWSPMRSLRVGRNGLLNMVFSRVLKNVNNSIISEIISHILPGSGLGLRWAGIGGGGGRYSGECSSSLIWSSFPTVEAHNYSNLACFSCHLISILTVNGGTHLKDLREIAPAIDCRNGQASEKE